MSEATFFHIALYVWLALAPATFVLLLFIRAPYGRHNRKGWGLQISSRNGWIIMEAPSAILMAIYYVASDHNPGVVGLALLGLWELHYFHRGFVYPFRRRDQGKTMPAAVVSMGVFFNLGNTYFNGRYLFHFAPPYPITYLTDGRFLIGVALFLTGFIINQKADWTLAHLRRPGETGYRIPRGGLYQWISCPNYFGEILEWAGWAVATWSMAGLTFAVWTMANLVPRALANHRWYQEKFPDYPANRRAVFPFLL